MLNHIALHNSTFANSSKGKISLHVLLQTHFGTSPNTHATEKLDKSLASELRTLNQK